jgi:hypothetical protein
MKLQDMPTPAEVARSLRNTNEYSSTPAGPRAGLYTVYAGRFVQSLIYVGLIYPM